MKAKIKNKFLILTFLLFVLFLIFFNNKTRTQAENESPSCSGLQEPGFPKRCYIGARWGEDYGREDYGTCGTGCYQYVDSANFNAAGGNSGKSWSAWEIDKWVYKCRVGVPLKAGYHCVKDPEARPPIYYCFKVLSYISYLCSTGDKYDPNAEGTWKDGYLNCGRCSLTQTQTCDYCRTPYRVCCTIDGKVASSRSGNEDNLPPSEGYCAGGAVKSVILDSRFIDPSLITFDPNSGESHPACKNVLLSCKVDPSTPQAGRNFKFIAYTSQDIGGPPSIEWRDCSGPNFNCNQCAFDRCTINNARAGNYKAVASMKDNTGKEIASTTCSVSVASQITTPPGLNYECLNSFNVKAGLCNISVYLTATGTNVKIDSNNGNRVVDPDDQFDVLYRISISGRDAVYECRQKIIWSWCDEEPLENPPPGCYRKDNERCKSGDKKGRVVYCEDIGTTIITNSATCYLDNNKGYVNFSGNFKIENKGRITKSGQLNMLPWGGEPANIVASGTIPIQTEKLGIVTFKIEASAQNQRNFGGASIECLNNICDGVNGATYCNCMWIGKESVRGTPYNKYSCEIRRETDNSNRTTRCTISLISRSVDLVPQVPRIEGDRSSLSRETKYKPKDYIAGFRYRIISEIIQNIKNNFHLGLNNEESYQGRGGYYEEGTWGIRGNLSTQSTLDNKRSGGSWRAAINFNPTQAGQYSFQTWHSGDDEFYLPINEETSGTLTVNVYRYLCYQGFCWECPQEPQASGTVLKVKETGCRVVDDLLCQELGYPYKGSCKGKGRE